MQVGKVENEKLALQNDIARYVEKEEILKIELKEARKAHINPIPHFNEGLMSEGRIDGGSYQGYVNRLRGRNMIVGKV